MEKKIIKIFSLLCFASVFFSCPLVDIPKARAISYVRGSPPAPILRRPFLHGKRRFFVGGGFYGGPNFPGRFYQTWYNNRYPVPYNFNKGTYSGRGPINIPYNLLNKNQYLCNGMNSLIPGDIAIEYPTAENRNQISFDNDGNFFHIYNYDDQYGQVNSCNQRFHSNRDSYFSERPYNGREKVTFDGTNILYQDGSLDKGHVEEAVVIKEPNTVIKGISNSASEKESLEVDEAHVIEKGIISQNVVAHAIKGGSANDEYIIKDVGVIDSELNNKKGAFVLSASGLEESVLSKEGSVYYSLNPNLTLHSIFDGKLMEINQGISQSTYEGDLNQKLNSDGNKGINYIVKGPTQDDSEGFYENRRFFTPSYGGNSGYGGVGSYIGGGIGQPTGFNGGSFNSLGAIGGGAGYSSGAAVGVGGSTQNGAGVYESASVSIGAGRGINREILTNGAVSVSGLVGISGDNGNGGGYSSIGGEASVSSGAGVGSGVGFGREVGIGGISRLSGGVGLGGIAGINGASINSGASFNEGNYQVPSQMNYIYRKAL